MHNPKTGRESCHIKQVPVTEDTLVYLAPQKQSLYFDSEITHSNYRLGYYKTLRLKNILELILMSSITEKVRNVLILHFQFSRLTFQAHGQTSLYY